jgi:hypothetical protein
MHYNRFVELSASGVDDLAGDPDARSRPIIVARAFPPVAKSARKTRFPASPRLRFAGGW